LAYIYTKMKKPRIIFFGTPEFAVPSLNTLLDNKYEIVGVVTSADEPNSKRSKSNHLRIKQTALDNNLKILQPTDLSDPKFINAIKELQPDIQVVVAFKMLPKQIWEIPAQGTFNLHASLLPQYRGAAPINWAIINNEKETGVTTFFLEQKVDTGNIIFQEKEVITSEDTAQTLHDRLKIKGASLVLKTVEAITNKNYNTIVQQGTGLLKKAPKIYQQNCEIDWNGSAEDIKNLVRGLSPLPGAFTRVNGKKLKIIKVSISQDGADMVLQPGEIRILDNKAIYIGTATQNLLIEVLQPEGKKQMSGRGFILGNKLPHKANN
jgi:methionyl-tRNA formyltransferase